MTNETRKELAEAKRIYKSKNYEDALEIYERIYEESAEALNEWDRIFFSWAIYYTHIKNFEDEEDLIESTSKVCELVKQADLNKAPTCAYTLSVFKVLDYLYSQNDWEDLIMWLEKLDPELLDDKKGEFNERTYPSKREKYYNYATKAYLESYDYDMCIETSKKALESMDSFVNDSDVWYRWRIAKSQKELGDYDDAIKYLEEVSKVKQDWFVSLEIADNYYFKLDNDNALKYAVEAALKPGPADLKVNLYPLLRDLVIDEYPNEALKHDYLVYTVRLAKGWPIDDDLKDKITEANLDTENTDYRSIEKELKGFWNSLKYKGRDLMTGTITKIFEHGKSGFITGEDGKSYYFNTFDFKDDKSELREYLSVTFYSEKSFDKSKNRESLKAVNINIL